MLLFAGSNKNDRAFFNLWQPSIFTLIYKPENPNSDYETCTSSSSGTDLRKVSISAFIQNLYNTSIYDIELLYTHPGYYSADWVKIINQREKIISRQFINALLTKVHYLFNNYVLITKVLKEYEKKDIKLRANYLRLHRETEEISLNIIKYFALCGSVITNSSVNLYDVRYKVLPITKDFIERSTEQLNKRLKKASLRDTPEKINWRFIYDS